MSGSHNAEPAGANTAGGLVAAPLHVTAAQAGMLFERIAGIAANVSTLSAYSVEAAGTDEEQVARLCAMKDLAALVGLLANSAVGESTVGSVADWACGDRFDET